LYIRFNAVDLLRNSPCPAYGGVSPQKKNDAIDTKQIISPMERKEFQFEG
jgi:hypothetical protein